jgi:hypothetical protein
MLGYTKCWDSTVFPYLNRIPLRETYEKKGVYHPYCHTIPFSRCLHAINMPYYEAEITKIDLQTRYCEKEGVHFHLHEKHS